MAAKKPTEQGKNESLIEDVFLTLTRAESREIERLEVEVKSKDIFKRSLDSPALAKAVMAISNFGGGIIIIGYVYDKKKSRYIEEDLAETTTFESTRLHDMLARYMEPVPEIDLLFEKGTKSNHPVLYVPPCGSCPIICTRDSDNLQAGAVYIRKPGPKSEAPKTASEWEKLLKSCLLQNRDELLLQIKKVVESQEIIVPTKDAARNLQKFIVGSDEKFEQYFENENIKSPGTYTFAYQLIPNPEKIPLRELMEFLREICLRRAVISVGNVGWLDNDNRAHPGDDDTLQRVETIKGDTGLGIRYWRLRPDGYFFQRNSFSEDYDKYSPGTNLELFWPCLGTVIAIVHSLRLSKKYRKRGERIEKVQFYVRYNGLSERFLVDGDNFLFLRPQLKCRTDKWERTTEIPMDLEVPMLMEITYKLLLPLYEKFDLFKFPEDAYNYRMESIFKIWGINSSFWKLV